jgi:hypothetical protein
MADHLVAGWDPVESREQYNPTAAEKQTAEKALASLPTEVVITGGPESALRSAR